MLNLLTGLNAIQT